MSARDKLFEAMAGGWSLTQNETEKLNQVIDNYAHELAERIRQTGSDQWDLGNQDWDAHDAADLIDPEKT